MPKISVVVKAERLANEDLLDVIRSPLITNPVQARRIGEQRLLPGAYHYDVEQSGVPYADLHDGDVVTLQLEDAGASGNRLVEEVTITGNHREGVFMKLRTSKVEGELDG